MARLAYCSHRSGALTGHVLLPCVLYFYLEVTGIKLRIMHHQNLLLRCVRPRRTIVSPHDTSSRRSQEPSRVLIDLEPSN